MKKTTQKVIIGGSIVVTLLVAICALGVWLVMQRVQQSPSRQQVKDGNAVAHIVDATSIERVAKDVSPSVVSILAQKAGRRVSQQGAGTGIIVSKDGYVVTNKHVIQDGTDIIITLADGTIYENVTIIGSDPLNDVAFLKIRDAENLVAAELGQSSTLRIGQPVVAIGNTLGEYQNTVTSGIVSGLGRPVAAQSGDRVESLTDLIQTDTAINPGNSGGPLVNLAGQVVGINTAVVNNAQGIGFAIPINAVKGMLEGVLAHGRVERAYIGVRYTDITPIIAKQRQLPVKRGALVLSGEGIEENGPADKAGIKAGDIIVKIGDQQVGQHGGVSSLVAAYKPGDTIDITVLRDGKEQKLSVTLAVYRAPERADRTPLRQQSLDPLFGF